MQRDTIAELLLDRAHDDQQAFLARFGCRLIEAYGSSESSGMIALAPDMLPGALGKPARDAVPIVEPATMRRCPPARLDSHSRVTNPEEAIGELVDAEGAARFEGYYKNPKADAERIRAGWYWTDDLAYTDEAGFLTSRAGPVTGSAWTARTSPRWRPSGCCARHPKIVAAAYGVPDPRSGDQAMAAIEIPAGTAFGDLDLVLPATGSGKIRKKELQMQAWQADDPVYRWAGRGEVEYTLMTSGDKAALAAEFTASGRQRFVPRATAS